LTSNELALPWGPCVSWNNLSLAQLDVNGLTA
jgi:hypothetical protein